MTDTAPQVDYTDRSTFIGGSDAGIILGWNRWETPRGLWRRKTGRDPDIEETEPMWWGTNLEPLILRRYEIATGNRVERPDTIAHPDHPWMVAHIDGIAITPDGTARVVEAKYVTRDSDIWGAEGTDEVPPTYIVQCQHYLAVTGFDACDLVTMVHGQTRIYPIERDETFISDMIEREQAFWRCVRDDIEPPPIDLRDLASTMPMPGTTVSADEEIVDTLRRLAAVKHQAKAIDEEKKALEDAIKRRFGETETMVDGAGEVLATWKGRVQNRLDTRAVQTRYPEVYEQCRTESTIRTLLLKEKAIDTCIPDSVE